MLQTAHPVLRRFWYPLMPVARLDAGPQPFTLLNTEIVVWRSADGSLGAVRDRCCHRSAKLSRGYVEGNCITCAYHGWAYGADGQVMRIPQAAPEQQGKPTGLSIDSYHVAERYGHVWVALEDPLSPIPELPEANDASLRRLDQFCEVWQCASMRVMENSFDTSHIAFTHRHSFGDITDVVQEALHFEETEQGFDVAERSHRAMNRTGAAEALRVEGEMTQRTQTAQWFMPFSRRLAIRYPSGLQCTFFTGATPIDDKSCMLVQFCFRSDTEEEVSFEAATAYDRIIVDEDRVILESMEYDVPLVPTREEEIAMRSDRPGLTIRRRMRELLAAHGETESRLRPELQIAVAR
ncbi:aromatic ring-hydroxylating dioxygenase subunit alpha [Xylophilus sp. GOD-11R]|uniref:aromatic ring-hydroxylating dioxygenase subunit alpha n=1 Tax=Xylophilus sp. GOD-11R TaxID=3089814 RepID=UPI00298C9273|nr:aromatic ring-hydroxylating dioxygenase subunit alpha [Xylophilus sp. GOD-11R]WPB56134.1 aromatic ring-hydroxylating dioxygenase subunit alpha [Xylophilus sp. GOD-11R]